MTREANNKYYVSGLRKKQIEMEGVLPCRARFSGTNPTQNQHLSPQWYSDGTLRSTRERSNTIIKYLSNTDNLTMEDATVESEPTMAAERVEDENGELAVVGVEEEVETDMDTDADADESTPTMTADEPVAAPATATTDDNDNAVAVEEVELPPPRLMITKMVSWLWANSNSL